MAILILDDQKENYSKYKTLLNSIGPFIQYPNMQNLMEDKNLNPELIIIEVYLENETGFNYYHKIRVLWPTVPILFISKDYNEKNIIHALNMGALDYLSRDHSNELNQAKIKNKIKKTSEKFIYEGLTFTPSEQLVELDGQKIRLTPIETKILEGLFKNKGSILTKERLLKDLWMNTHVQTSNIDTHLSNIKKKLAPFSEKIKTIKYRGYILN